MSTSIGVAPLSVIIFFIRPVTEAFGEGVPGAGFEPAKLYAEDLESTPFDRSGTPACRPRSDLLFLTIALHQGHPNPWAEVGAGCDQAWQDQLAFG